MELTKLTTKQLEKYVKRLRHVKAIRQGGLLIGEQTALTDMEAELERRADIAYCKAHDC